MELIQSSWGFDIIATYNPDESDQSITILSALDQTVTTRTKPQISVPVALAGFRKYRWEVTDTGSTTTTLGSVHMAYCKASGSVCPAIDNYPSVGEGQISPSSVRLVTMDIHIVNVLKVYWVK